MAIKYSTFNELGLVCTFICLYSPFMYLELLLDFRGTVVCAAVQFLVCASALYLAVYLYIDYQVHVKARRYWWLNYYS